jgi:DNA-directed RNA polymerase subunit K/omega
MIMKGAKPLVETDNRSIVTALREVAAGKTRFKHREDRERGSGLSDHEI